LVGGEVGLDSSAPAFTGIPPHIELSTTFLRMVGDAEPQKPEVWIRNCCKFNSHRYARLAWGVETW
jgi:hypothetical protein